MRPASSSPDVDIVVSHLREGQMRLVSRYLFADPKAEVCQRFIGRIFEVEEVRAVEILAQRGWAHVEYVKSSRQVIAKISRHLRHGGNGGRAPYVNSPRDLPLAFAGGVEGWRVERHGAVLSTWEIKHELPGRIRFRNRLIHGKEDVCRAIDRSLTRVRGIERYRTNPHTATVLIVYDPRKVLRHQLIQSLDQALVDAERRDHEALPSRPFPVGTASLGLAAAGLFFAPSLVPFMLLEIAVLGGALCLLGLQAFRKSPEPLPAADAQARPRPSAAQEASIEIPSSRRLFTIGGLALGVSAIGDAFYPPLSLLTVPAAAHTTRGLYESGYHSLVRERRLTVDGLAAGINALNLMCLRMPSAFGSRACFTTRPPASGPSGPSSPGCWCSSRPGTALGRPPGPRPWGPWSGRSSAPCTSPSFPSAQSGWRSRSSPPCCSVTPHAWPIRRDWRPSRWR